MMLYRLPVTIFGAGHVTSAVARTWTAEHGVALAAAHGLAGFDRAGVTGRLSRTSSQRRHLGVRRHRGRPTREDGAMRFMLLQNYGQVESDCQPMTEWTPGDIKAHIEFQHALNQELAESGELVDAQGLAGPELAKFVVSDGASAPVITDGPFPEAKELLAGYRMVDVETAARAIEIAAQASAAPGPNGVPIRQPIEVREVMSAPDPEV
jgi:hypothetical protein